MDWHVCKDLQSASLSMTRCQFAEHFGLEYIVEKDAANGSAADYVQDNDLVVLQERIITPPSKLHLAHPISSEPLVILNDENLPIQRSVIAAKHNVSLEQLDSGIFVDAEEVRMLFSHPLRTGSEVSFQSFNNAYLCLESLLDQARLKQNRIVRTWFLVKDIFRDYDLINQVRDEWFAKWHNKEELIPASTGIQSAINRAGHFSLEFIAIDGEAVSFEQMHCSMQNEPTEYNKMFSRGVLVRLPASNLAFISGTASTDKQGQVKHAGDIDLQFQHTLDCIDDLLTSVNMEFEDIAQGIIWLKRKAYKEQCLEIAERNSFPTDRCLLLVDCNVCRDDWLCEIEVTAFRNGR